MRSFTKLVSLVSLVFVLNLGFTLQSNAGDPPGTTWWRLRIVDCAYSCQTNGLPAYKLVGANSTWNVADCSGWVWLVYNKISKDWATYNFRTVSGLASVCRCTNNPKPGDLVLFWKAKKDAYGDIGWNHCGIYVGGGVGNGNFIHCHVANKPGGETMTLDNIFSGNTNAGYSKNFWVDNFYIYFVTYPPDRLLN